VKESKAATEQLSKVTTLHVLEARHEKRPVRFVMLDGAPWFVASDLTRIFPDHRNLGRALMRVASEDRVRIYRGHLTSGRKQLRGDESKDVWFISETGIYELVFLSRHEPGATNFKQWLTRELMPTIRYKNLPSTARVDLPILRDIAKVNPERDVERENAKQRSKRRRAKARHALYRFYTADGELLYIGISWQVATRMGSHRATQRWWQNVAVVRFEWYPDRESAVVAEKKAIQTERPRCNIMMR
jgi:prophage antirepressor-like protein